MPRRQPLSPPTIARRARSATASAVVAIALTACGSDATGPVSVPAATPNAASAQACARLDDALPQTVLDQPARSTEPDSPTTAAWGDPAIVLVCGVPRPAARTPGAQLFDVDGVTWFAQELTAGTRFTSEGRLTNVQVDVPDDYRPEAEALVDLAPAIAASIPAKR